MDDILKSIMEIKPNDEEVSRVRAEIGKVSDRHQPALKTQRLTMKQAKLASSGDTNLDTLNEIVDHLYEYYDCLELKNLSEKIKQKIQSEKNAMPAGAIWLGTKLDPLLKNIKYKIEKLSDKKPTISACMIIKDEAYLIADRVGKPKHINLRACIASWIDYVDEVIICDTGSDDRTIKVIETLQKKYKKIKLYRDEWVNFEHNRKLSVERATKEWVLIVDADERLRFKDYSLKDVINKWVEFGYNGVKFAYQEYKHGEVKTGGTTNWRIIPRKNIDIVDPIHNQINGVHKGGITQEIVLEHHGYVISARRTKRIKQTLKECIATARREKDNPVKYSHFMYKAGEAYYNLYIAGAKFYIPLALRYFLIADKTADNLPENIRCQLYWYIACCYEILGYRVSAYRYLERMLRIDPDNLDAYYAASLIHYNAKQYKTAAELASAYWLSKRKGIIKNEMFYMKLNEYERMSSMLVELADYNPDLMLSVDWTKHHKYESYNIILGVLLKLQRYDLLATISQQYYTYFKEASIAANLLAFMAEGLIEYNAQLVTEIIDTHKIVYIVWYNAHVLYRVVGESVKSDNALIQAKRLENEIIREGENKGN